MVYLKFDSSLELQISTNVQHPVTDLATIFAKIRSAASDAHANRAFDWVKTVVPALKYACRDMPCKLDVLHSKENAWVRRYLRYCVIVEIFGDEDRPTIIYVYFCISFKCDTGAGRKDQGGNLVCFGLLARQSILYAFEPKNPELM